MRDLSQSVTLQIRLLSTHKHNQWAIKAIDQLRYTKIQLWTEA